MDLMDRMDLIFTLSMKSMKSMKSMNSISAAMEQPCTHRILPPFHCFCIAPRRQIP